MAGVELGQSLALRLPAVDSVDPVTRAVTPPSSPGATAAAGGDGARGCAVTATLF